VKKIIAIAAFAATAAISSAPAKAQMSGLSALAAASPTETLVQKTGKRGRLAAGLAIGIVGAAIASHAYADRNHYRGRRMSRHERRCRRWRRWCRDGEGRACWKFDNRC